METNNESFKEVAFLREPQNADAYFAECGAGWNVILEWLFKDLQGMQDKGDISKITVDQVKEKFGGLRVYITLEGPEAVAAHNLCYRAEQESLETCEICSRHGSPRRTVGCWIKTLCGEHHFAAEQKGSYDVT